LSLRGVTAEDFVSDVVCRHLPEVARLTKQGKLNVENVDVFCERGVFDVQQTRTILEAASKLGLRINFHGEELSCLNSAEVTHKNYSILLFVSKTCERADISVGFSSKGSRLQ
jgi:imidazolonepropionase-like amidohydrolase